jgi:GrpB-like predicted nucleotidyltransferase (UPF0157 family)
MVQVVRYSEQWPHQFERAAARLRAALEGAPGARVEHVGSTSVPGLAAKPIIDIDVVVAAHQMLPAIAALEQIGYVHDGDLGLDGREAFDAPDDDPPRHVYVCLEGTLHVRNHLAVRDILRRRPDLRDSYAAVKLALAEDPDMDIDTYIAGKSSVLQEVLAESDLTEAERRLIRELNGPTDTVLG